MPPTTQVSTATEPVTEMRRPVKAPRDKVFAAWTNAAALAAWMGFKSVTARIEGFNLKPSGACRVIMVGENEHISTGTYLETEPPERIAHRRLDQHLQLPGILPRHLSCIIEGARNGQRCCLRPSL